MKRYVFLFAALQLLVSCSDKSFNLTAPEGDVERGGGMDHGMIQLGSRLEDPYSVSNVTKAVEALYPTKAGRLTIDPTDLYVRILPDSGDEMAMLENLGLYLLDHPMDYEILREGDYYHDPSVADTLITWQYAVAPIGFNWPEGVKYELLDEVYLAENDNSTKSGIMSDIDWDEVERKSYELTGNASMLSPETKGGSKKLFPKGRITVLDEDYDSEPVGLSGAKICCNVFVKVARCFADDEGYYKMDKSFASDPRYRISFCNSKGFTIGISTIFNKASVSTLGKHSNAGYTLTVTPDSDESLFTRAVVNNAGYDYIRGCNIDGMKMKTPPSNFRIWILKSQRRSFTPMLQQGVFIDGSFIEDYLGEFTFIAKMFMPDSFIALKEKKSSYADIYAEAVHQFAHASHFMQVGKDWWKEYCIFLLTSFVSSGWMSYGVGTESGAGYGDVAETWAYYAANKYFGERYPESSRTFGTSYWFSPQILMYLDERGMNKFNIFSAMTYDVKNRDNLRNKLLALYPEFKSSINQAFSRYQ